MRRPSLTINDDKFIPIVMMLAAHGYETFRYEETARLVTKKGPEPWGTGYKTRNIIYRRELFARGDTIYKLWAKDFLWASNILDGVLSEFYDSTLTSALVGVILDDDADVRGYVMHKAKRLNNEHQWAQMIGLLCERTKETKMCFPDCIKQNMGVYKGKLTLFDLENVVAAKRGLQTKFKGYDKVVSEVGD